MINSFAIRTALCRQQQLEIKSRRSTRNMPCKKRHRTEMEKKKKQSRLLPPPPYRLPSTLSFTCVNLRRLRIPAQHPQIAPREKKKPCLDESPKRATSWPVRASARTHRGGRRQDGRWRRHEKGAPPGAVGRQTYLCGSAMHDASQVGGGRFGRGLCAALARTTTVIVGGDGRERNPMKRPP
jgi:hypothetical protein